MNLYKHNLLSFAFFCFIIAVSIQASNLDVQSYFNVKDFGATGNGSTPDGTAIQNAIDACRLADGGTVYFPAGNYIIDKTLYIGSGTGTSGKDAGNGVCLLGEGVQRTRLMVKTGVGAIVLRGGAAGSYSIHNSISGMSFLKDNIDYSDCVSGGSAIKISQAIQAKIENIWIWNYGSARFQNGIFISTDCHGTILRNIDISGADYGAYCSTWDTKINNFVCDIQTDGQRVLYGVFLNGPSDATTISESKFMGCDYGIYVNGGVGNRILNNTIGDCRITGIYVTSTSSVYNMGLLISGNEMEGNGATHTPIPGGYGTTKSNFQHNEIWIVRTAPSIARGITILGNQFNLTGMKDISGNVLISPYDISDPVQVAECTFNRNIYQDYAGGTFSSEGFSVGVIPVATANSSSTGIQAGSLIKFSTSNNDASGATGIVANPKGWTRIDPNGSRFIIPVSPGDVNSSRNVLDMERYDTWAPLIQFNANGGAFFNGPVGIGNPSPAQKLDVNGNIKSGNGAWNGGHFIMGNYHFWVDASGELRMKNGAPLSDKDGQTVGSQQ